MAGLSISNLLRIVLSCESNLWLPAKPWTLRTSANNCWTFWLCIIIIWPSEICWPVMKSGWFEKQHSCESLPAGKTGNKTTLTISECGFQCADAWMLSDDLWFKLMAGKEIYRPVDNGPGAARPCTSQTSGSREGGMPDQQAVMHDECVEGQWTVDTKLLLAGKLKPE